MHVAITELRPDKFLVYDTSVDDYEMALLAKKYKDVPDVGIWVKYGTWEYFMHGGGCRLTSTVTGERLEWDVPHQDLFELEWFLNWFRWLRKCNLDYASISDKEVYAAINHLQETGIIKRKKIPSGYKLYLVD